MELTASVRLTEKEYYDYNRFWMLRSPYGKTQVRGLRLMLLAATVLGCLPMLLREGWTVPIILLTVLLTAVFQCLVRPLFSLSLKLTVKRLKRTGKLPFSAASEIRFTDDRLIETTAEGKTEILYTAVERISIVENTILYVHANSVVAYLIPQAACGSEAQFHALTAFLTAKCATVDWYSRR